MQLTINIDEHSEKAKKLFLALRELGIGYVSGTITPKDAAFGIGRKATEEELDAYLDRCMKGKLTDLDTLA